VLTRETGQPIGDPVKLISPMVERFMATDRGFAKARRDRQSDRSPVSTPGLSKD